MPYAYVGNLEGESKEDVEKGPVTSQPQLANDAIRTLLCPILLHLTLKRDNLEILLTKLLHLLMPVYSQINPNREEKKCDLSCLEESITYM